MKLTLIRHGPTENNAARRFQGHSDVPLSQQGRAQARAIAAALRDDPIERIYSSDLARAMETARVLADLRGMEIVSDARLREFDFGAWEGLSWDEIVAANPHLAGRGSTAAKLYAPPNGESFEQVSVRARDFLNDLRPKELGMAAVVTHAGMLHAIFAVLGLDNDASPGDNLSLRFTPSGITRVELNGARSRLIALNDLRHLDAAS